MSSNLKFIFVLFLIFVLSFSTIAQTFTSSNLPLVVLSTNGQTIKDDPKVIVDMGIIWNGPGKRNALSDPKNNYNGKVGIEWRGSS
ncbi:MAG: spore coat protein CotH, partial [Bacteroidota bacterium]|nr:spore coat protein CotH [Bacteroidota bacterium]